MKEGRNEWFRAGFATCMAAMVVLFLCQTVAVGQVDQSKKRVTAPVINPSVAKKIPKQVIPSSSGGEVVITLLSPAMGQKNVPLDALLQWNATLPGLKFDVYLAKQRNLDASGNPVYQLVSRGQTATTFQPALVDAEIYYWKIVAKKVDGKEFASPMGFFKTPNAPPLPAQPEQPALGALNVSTLPDLKWEPSVDPENNRMVYTIFLSTDRGQYSAPLARDIAGNSYQTITPLRHGETYYWKVVTRDDAHATSESVEFSFTVDPVNWSQPIAAGSFTDTRDNKVYRTVKIGNQEWMAENLAYLPAVNNLGTESNIPMYKVYGYSGNQVAEARSNSNYSNYGVLYNWNAAQEVCPAGWHLPSEAEWNELLGFLGMTSGELSSNFSTMSDIVADKMRETDTNRWLLNPPTVNNASHFDARPSGFANQADYLQLGTTALWWSSTWSSSEGIVTVGLGYNQQNMSGISKQRAIVYPLNFYAIRCVKD